MALIAPLRDTVLRHPGETAHRAIFEHHGDSQQFGRHLTVADDAGFGKIPAILIKPENLNWAATLNTVIGSADPGVEKVQQYQWSVQENVEVELTEVFGLNHQAPRRMLHTHILLRNA